MDVFIVYVRMDLGMNRPAKYIGSSAVLGKEHTIDPGVHIDVCRLKDAPSFFRSFRSRGNDVVDSFVDAPYKLLR